MAGSHYIVGTRESDASDYNSGSPDNKNPEGEVNHQRRWDKYTNPYIQEGDSEPHKEGPNTTTRTPLEGQNSDE